MVPLTSFEDTMNIYQMVIREMVKLQWILPKDGLQGYPSAYAALSGSRYISIGPSTALDTVFRPATAPFYQPYVPWMARPYTLEGNRLQRTRTVTRIGYNPSIKFSQTSLNSLFSFRIS
ncbi:hypothetical protein NPIL_47121 [Nephila pilipes]|uniref:Uncharacterized protein n=1 Tax=Nephila pilipes TaxID=299642 RepID=A0A8X6PZ74_NEPPI|nr:hypothetical protein NPIL_47121 [Nephila pilipes]